MSEQATRLIDLYTLPAVYDLLCRKFGGEEFFADVASQIGGEFLELACGTGRIVGTVAGRGLPCWGTDISREMVAFASGRFPHIEFIEGDMKSFRLDRRFQCIALAGNSFQQLLQFREWASVFECVRCHLGPSGEFVVSLVNPTPIMLREIPEGSVVAFTYDDPRTGDLVSVTHSFSFDCRTRVGTTTWVHRGSGGEAVMRNVFKLLYPKPLRVLGLAQKNGFRLRESYGSFSGEPFTSASPLQIYRFVLA